MKAEQDLLRFVRQWLGVSSLPNLVRDAGRYPGFHDGIKDSMARELDAFVLRTLVRDGGGLEALLTAPHTYVDADLASFYGFTPEEFPAIRTFQAEARARAEKSLQAEKEKVERDAIVETILLEGNPLHALLDHAEAQENPIVVVGTHGHGVIASMLLGSVAEGVVRKGKVPALIVPAPQRK